MQKQALFVDSVILQIEGEVTLDWIKVTGHKLSVETSEILEIVQVNPDLTVTIVTNNT